LWLIAARFSALTPSQRIADCPVIDLVNAARSVLAVPGPGHESELLIEPGSAR
jgi:hypothetical protein